MLNYIKKEWEGHTSYKIEFENRMGCYDLHGEIYSGKKHCQIVVCYGACQWLYQDFAPTLEEAKKKVEKKEEWFYRIARRINDQVIHYQNSLVDQYKVIIDEHGYLDMRCY